jgi:hypothetical protein
MKNFKYFIITFGCLSVLFSSCKKQDDFLNAKPQQSLSTITNVQDVYKLLNNQDMFNHFASPSWGETFTDDFYITSDSWIGNLVPEEQQAFIFAKEIFTVSSLDNSWNNAYTQIYDANTILDALPKITGEQSDKNQVRGSALFFRSLAFYELLQTYSMPYDSVTSKDQLGIPLRLTSNLNDKSVRSSLQNCYDQIINDLKNASILLPNTSQFITLPNKLSCNALLARIYLATGNYNQAYSASNTVLSNKNTLFDFNNLMPSASSLTNNTQYPLNEDIFHRTLGPASSLSNSTAIIDSVLYNSYDSNDLRKTAYFFVYNNSYRYKGSYEFKSRGQLFSGLAIDEIYLIRAECNARLGHISEAMTDLNALLVNRYKKGTFQSRTASNIDDAVRQILLERRKELCFRGIRWDDMRRLNKTSQYAVTIKRIINGNTYILSPNDPKYAMEIPLNEIQLSGIQQNLR